MSEWTDEELETANAGLIAAARLDDLEDARAEVAALTCLLEMTRRELDDARTGRDIAAVYDELVKVQDELERVRAERDGLMCAPIWCPPEQDDAMRGGEGVDVQEEVAALERMARRSWDLGAMRTLYEWRVEATERSEIGAAREAMARRYDRYEGKNWLRSQRYRRSER